MTRSSSHPLPAVLSSCVAIVATTVLLGTVLLLQDCLCGKKTATLSCLLGCYHTALLSELSSTSTTTLCWPSCAAGQLDKIFVHLHFCSVHWRPVSRSPMRALFDHIPTAVLDHLERPPFSCSLYLYKLRPKKLLLQDCLCVEKNNFFLIPFSTGHH